MRWVAHVARVEEKRDVYSFLVGKSEGKRPRGIFRHRWENNIKMDLQEVRCASMDWIELAQDKYRWRALVKAVTNFRFRYNVGNFLTSCKTVSFSGRNLRHGVSVDLIANSYYFPIKH
jgi:hypothetical protein